MKIDTLYIVHAAELVIVQVARAGAATLVNGGRSRHPASSPSGDFQGSRDTRTSLYIVHGDDLPVREDGVPVLGRGRRRHYLEQPAGDVNRGGAVPALGRHLLIAVAVRAVAERARPRGRGEASSIQEDGYHTAAPGLAAKRLEICINFLVRKL